MRLRKKLTLAFLLLTLFTFVLITVFANFILGKQFETYTLGKLNSTIDDTVEQLKQLYARSGNKWSALSLEEVGMDLLSEGFILRVRDGAGSVVWDAQEHNNGMCMLILENMAKNMQAYHGGFDGGYEEKQREVVLEGKTAGTVFIGYYGPYFYSDADIQFLDGLNRFLLIAAGVSLALCLLLGAYLAKLIAGPIAAVIGATGKIAAGDYSNRIPANSSTAEIIELTGSVNSLADSLEEQARLRKRLTADVAHELRTPLTALQGHVEAMIDGVWEPDAKRLSVCREEILRLAKLVDELGTLSRYDGEHLKLNREPIDLMALSARIGASFEEAFRQKRIEYALSDANVTIDADGDKVSQILVNLLANALKFTPEGGRIALEVGETEHDAMLTVRDTGCGIPAADLPYIFERFYRADASRSRQSGGAGVGLTIALAIARAHGGDIRVESAPGAGSAFTVTLPKKKAE